MYLISDTEVAPKVALEPTDFCTCGNCRKMDTFEECTCCLNNRLYYQKNMFSKEGMCVTDHIDFGKIICKTVLEVNLKIVWDAGTFDTYKLKNSYEKLKA